MNKIWPKKKNEGVGVLLFRMLIEYVGGEVYVSLVLVLRHPQRAAASFAVSTSWYSIDMDIKFKIKKKIKLLRWSAVYVYFAIPLILKTPLGLEPTILLEAWYQAVIVIKQVELLSNIDL